MKITLLGTGTSQGIPVIGCQCQCCTSTDPQDKRLRTSALISYQGKEILIDIGPDFRSQMLSNHLSHVDFVLMTHEHNDHTAGLDDIRPINFSSGKHIDLYGPTRVMTDLRERFAYAFASEPYPGAPRIFTHDIDTESPINIEGIDILPLDVMHGNLPIFGYKIGKMAYLTDVKYLPDTTIQRVKGCDVLIISALRFESHYSHITLEESLKYIDLINPKSAYLIHMSHTMGPVTVWQHLCPPHVKPGYDGLVITLDEA